jgi:hypothetical protein
MSRRNVRIPAPPGGGRLGPSYQPELSGAIDSFYRAATRLSALDAEATEVLRLRCARHHDCRICQAVRLRDARDVGVDESTLDKIDRYETSDLEERLKVMLRYVDAFITSPGSISGGLAADLRHHFTREQIVEMTLDIMKFSSQKIHVTLGVDIMDGVDVESGAITFFEFDDEGRPVNFLAAAVEPAL